MSSASVEDELEVLTVLEQLTKEKEEFVATRQSFLPRNIGQKRKEFQNSKLVKSDVKKSNAFVKKIKSINAEGIQQCLRDTDTLNLTLFISEIVAAILSIPFKATDVSMMVKLCQSLHAKYDEFTEPLITGLKTVLLSPGGEGEGDAEVGKKKRIQIRFAIELYQAGLFNDEDFFNQLLRGLLGKPNKAGPGKGMIDLQGLSTFVKYASEILLGFPPKKLLDIMKKIPSLPKTSVASSDLPIKLLASPKTSSEMKTMLLETFQTICHDLVEAHKQFRVKEAKFEKDRLLHGSLTEQKQIEFDNSKKLYEKLLSVATSLAEAIGEPIPELKFEKTEDEGGGGITVWEGSGPGANAAEEAALNGGFFGDAETRAFYEDLPDLLNLVPLSILGFTHDQAEALRSEWDAKQQEQKIEEDQELPNPDQASRIEEEMAAATQEEVATDDIDTEIAEENESEKVAAPGPVLGASADGPVPTGDDAANSAGAAGEENRNAKLNQLLTERLLECIQKNKTDEFTVSFCYASNNSKAARKRLVTAIAKIPRSRPELAPNYARIVASLARLYPDMVPPLVEMLKKEFYFVIKHRKSSLHVDHKVKTIRLLSELMKFRLTPPIVLLKVFKSLLLDLTPHHIEMLTVGLETCGRFLYLLPYTKDSMETLLEMLVRLRRAKNLDLYHQTLLDSAYFAVKPPEKKAAANKKAKERSLLEQYIRHLIIDKLDIHDSSTSIDQVIKSCRRLPWNQRDVHVEEYLLKASLKLARTKYVTIPNLADCLSGLAKYYPNTITAVVDVCLEEIQRSLEIPYKREIQRILGYTRLVGELYNFTAIPSTIIFDLLYHLVHYGHGNWGKLLLDYPQSPALQSTVPPYLLNVLHASGIPPTNPLPATTQISGTSNNAANPNPNPSNTAASSVSMGPASVQIPFIPSGNTNSPIPINYFDPRILSEFDLPTDLFRAQIVCELLNTCGDYYVRGVLKERLGKFLVYFQRYLLTKQMIPLHIEFCILDTFDYLEEQARESFLESMPAPAQPAPVTAAFSKKKKKSKAKQLAAMEAANSRDNVVVPVSFPRYDNFEAVQRVIEGWEANLLAQQRAEPGAMSIGQAATMDEEEELLIIEEKRNAVRGDEEDLVAQPNGNSNAPAPAAAGKGEEEDSEDSDDEEEDDDDDSSSDDSDDDDSEEGEELNEDLLDVDEEEEEEAAAKLLEKMRIVEEDEEFERQFKSAVQESISSVTSKYADVNKMVIPTVLPKPKNTLSMEDESTQQNKAAATAGPTTMKFSLLSRDNKGRLEARQLLVPKENRMAVKLAKAEEEARLEKLKIKERTLALNSMNADHDYDLADLGHHEPTAFLPSTTGSSSAKLSQSTGGTGVKQADGSAASNTASSTAGNGGTSLSAKNIAKSFPDRRGGGGRGGGSGKYGVRAEETRKAADTLNLDEFLAESSAAEMRRIGSRKN